jgi:POT family proton-dependent oligopeptide transporter
MSSPPRTPKHAPHPPGLPYIIGNEAAERFSYYGMKSILVIVMTTSLLGAQGKPAPMSEDDAMFWFHTFTMGNYLFPLLGALLSDTVWGKYRTIIRLSVVYCLGHLALALDETRLGLAIGLTLIAIGSGGIKPCVSAHLGDQYHHRGSSAITEGFSLFYLAINLGAFFSSLAIPWTYTHYGAQIAFAIPGVIMGLATTIFWVGRNRYVTLPPTHWRSYMSSILSGSDRSQHTRLALLFVLLSIFWSLFDQTSSSWVFQAEHMDRRLAVPLLGAIELLPAQLQAINPLLIIVFTPLFAWGIYPLLARTGLLSAKSKITMGLALTSASFIIIAIAQELLSRGTAVSITWQISAYVLLTAAEVLISVTTLEMAYTSAPRASKSFATSFYLLSVALGNGFTALCSGYASPLIGSPSSSSYFFFFAILPILVALPVFMLSARIDRTSYRATDLPLV